MFGWVYLRLRLESFKAGGVLDTRLVSKASVGAAWGSAEGFAIREGLMPHGSHSLMLRSIIEIGSWSTSYFRYRRICIGFQGSHTFRRFGPLHCMAGPSAGSASARQFRRIPSYPLLSKRFDVTSNCYTLFWNQGISVASPDKPDVSPRIRCGGWVK